MFLSWTICPNTTTLIFKDCYHLCAALVFSFHISVLCCSCLVSILLFCAALVLFPYFCSVLLLSSVSIFLFCVALVFCFHISVLFCSCLLFPYFSCSNLPCRLPYTLLIYLYWQSKFIESTYILLPWLPTNPLSYGILLSSSVSISFPN